MTISQALQKYLTDIFKLPNNEEWQCETIDEESDNVLDPKYLSKSLSGITITAHIFYSDSLYKHQLTPFILKYQNKIIAIGYMDGQDMDYLYLNNFKHILINELHLLNNGKGVNIE